LNVVINSGGDAQAATQRAHEIGPTPVKSEPSATNGRAAKAPTGTREWTFLTHHAHALLVIARVPGVRIRDIAAKLGVTERAAHRIVGELVEGGYLTRHKLGSRNFYEVHPGRPLRDPVSGRHDVGELLAPLLGRSVRPPSDAL
jgi:MarR family